PAPGESFPGRAVGGDVHGVAAEAPVGDLVQTVQVRAAAGEGAGAAQVRVHDLHGDARRIEVRSLASEPRVLEPVHRVGRLERGGGAVGDDLVALAEHDGFAVASCGVEVRGVQVAVGADVLAVIDHRAGARR